MQSAQNSLQGYTAARESTGWRDLSSRAKIGLTGPDRISFLHAMISNDVSGLKDFSGRYGTLLTATGKIVADFWYYRLPDSVLVDISGALRSQFMEQLGSFIIMDDVELTDISSEFDHFSFHGPTSGVLLQELLGAPPPGQAGLFTEVYWRDRVALVIRKAELTDEEFEVLVPKDRGGEFRKLVELGSAGPRRERISDEEYEILRLERGIPLFGVDMSDKNNPLEARLSSAYSLTKGCYPGQEVVARATHIGGVARLLSRLWIGGSFLPSPGQELFDEGGSAVGWITSAASSPALGTTVALGYLKRAVAMPGRSVYLKPDETSKVSAEVVEK